MGDGVNIAARLEGIAQPGAICLSEDAYRQVSGRLDMAVADLGPTQLKNIERPIRVYSLEVGHPAQAKPATPGSSAKRRPSRKGARGWRFSLLRGSSRCSARVRGRRLAFLGRQPLRGARGAGGRRPPFDNLGGDEQASRSPTE